MTTFFATNRIDSRDQSERLILISFLLFVLATTFSIAMAQVTLGLALIVFLIHIARIRQNPFSGRLTTLYYLIGLYLLWMILTSILASGLLPGLREVKSLWLFFIIPVGLFLCRRERTLGLILIALALGTLAGSMAGIAQFFTGIAWPGVEAPVEDPYYGYLAQGFFSVRSTFANCFAMPALLFLSLGLTGSDETVARSIKRLFLVTGIMASLAIVLSFNRAGIGALLAGLILLLIWYGRQRWKSLTALVLGMALLILLLPGLQDKIVRTIEIDLNHKMYTGRLFIWQKSVEMLKQNPLLGVGAGHYKEEFVKLSGRPVGDDRLPDQAHNDWLSVATNGGVPGLLIFMLVWYVLLRSIWSSQSFDSSGRRQLSPALVALTGALVMTLVTGLFEDEEAMQMILLIWTLGLAPRQWPRPELDRSE